MRTAEERINAMHLRAAEIQTERKQRNVNILSSAVAIAGFAAVILLGIMMPGLTDKVTINGVYDGYNASIFSESSTIGFVVVAILSFLLGAAVTVFCFRIRKLSKLGNKESEEHR